MKRLPHTALILLMPLLAAAQSDDSREPAPEIMNVVAEVIEFTPFAIWEHYEDGGFACFATTQLLLRAPAELDGKELRVLHNTPDLPVGSPWRAVGRQFRFSIESTRLMNALAGEIPTGDGDTYTTYQLVSAGIDLADPQPRCRAKPKTRRWRPCFRHRRKCR